MTKREKKYRGKNNGNKRRNVEKRYKSEEVVQEDGMYRAWRSTMAFYIPKMGDIFCRHALAQKR